MSARSIKQRRYLYWRFGPAWARRHHFNNKGKLPYRVRKRRVKRRRRR